MTKSQIAVRIPRPLLDQLNGYIEQTGSSKTEVVIGALAQYLDSVDTVPLMKRIAELERRLARLETKVETQ